MMFTVIIPDWSEGKCLRVEHVNAASEEKAESQVVDWINELAHYNYCTKLPPGTKIIPEGGAA